MSFPGNIDLAEARLLVRDETVRTKLRKALGRSKALEIIESIVENKLPKNDEGALLDALYDIVSNDGKTYSRFIARGSEDTYHIDIKGLGGLYWTNANEFDDEGFFSSLDDAENYVIKDWNDNLISGKPRRFRKSFEIDTTSSEMVASVTDNLGSETTVPSPHASSKRTRPAKPQLRIDSVGALSRLEDGTYYLHQTSLFMSAETLSAEKLAIRILKAFNGAMPSAILTLLGKHDWMDVVQHVQSPPSSYLQEKQLEAAKRELEAKARASSFQAYLDVWIPQNASKWPHPRDQVYWAAREYIWDKGNYASHAPEDISVRRLHYAAQSVVANWTTFYGKS